MGRDFYQGFKVEKSFSGTGSTGRKCRIERGESGKVGVNEKDSRPTYVSYQGKARKKKKK